MIVKVQHEFDGKIIRARFWSSFAEDKTFTFLGTLAMTQPEFDRIKVVLTVGGEMTGVLMHIEPDPPVKESREEASKEASA